MIMNFITVPSHCKDEHIEAIITIIASRADIGHPILQPCVILVESHIVTTAVVAATTATTAPPSPLHHTHDHSQPTSILIILMRCQRALPTHPLSWLAGINKIRCIVASLPLPRPMSPHPHTCHHHQLSTSSNLYD
jgi:hypothetical protein